jgi:outer membrane translocation and assembly module TamA
MYASPIGPLELTIAHAYDPHEKGYRVQFTMGADL